MRVILASSSWTGLPYCISSSGPRAPHLCAPLPPTYTPPDLAPVPFRGHRRLHLDRTGTHLPSSFVGRAPSIIVACVLPTSTNPRHPLYCTPSLSGSPPPSVIFLARSSRAWPTRVLCADIWVPQRGLTYDGRVRILSKTALEHDYPLPRLVPTPRYAC
ncbi:hypothetical protein B0H13DRAFT_1098482 [Mycena leptocephala]|nr:hypothetical protein B0H13DRAFT_1098482 [Mycena leptocephala]